MNFAGSNRQTGRKKEEKSKCGERNDSSSDYEEVGKEKPALKFQTLPNKLQPSCMKSSKFVTLL